MNSYDLIIDDIYSRENSKKITLKAINVYIAHKEGLKQTNALREEISKITKNGNTVFTFKSGFSEE